MSSNVSSFRPIEFETCPDWGAKTCHQFQRRELVAVPVLRRRNQGVAGGPAAGVPRFLHVGSDFPPVGQPDSRRMGDNSGMLPEAHGRSAERPVLIVEDSENSAAMQIGRGAGRG